MKGREGNGIEETGREGKGRKEKEEPNAVKEGKQIKLKKREEKGME